MQLQRIIIDNKLARDFIDIVLLSICGHVIELVSILQFGNLVALSATDELVSIATAKRKLHRRMEAMITLTSLKVTIISYI